MSARQPTPHRAAALIAAGLLASGALAAPEAAAPTSTAFTFAQICDTQLGMGGYEHDLRTFKLAVEQLNEIAPDFVLICGDLVNDADDKSFADFNRIKAGFRIPCHCAAGNHDVGKDPTAASLKRFREKVGRDYFAFEHKGYAFVVANTQLWKSSVPGESKRHEAWFRSTLEAAKAKDTPIVVVTHYPLFVKTPDEPEGYSNIAAAKRMQLLSLFETCGVVAILSGHTHKLVINEHQGIQLVAGETTSNNFDQRPMGFRIWRAGEDRALTHEFVQLKGGTPPAPTP